MTNPAYQTYLNSEAWQKRRRRALYLAQNQCQSPACPWKWTRSYTPDEILEIAPDAPRRVHVHHLTYERFGHERQDDLLVLCEDCHKAAHGVVDPGQEPEEFGTIGEAVRAAIRSITRGITRQ